MNILFTMAGKYERFKLFGNKIPKYLVPLGKNTVLWHVINSLPRKDSINVFFIANNNEPGIISKIAECLATNKINISEFVNKSRGDLACNIIDTDDEIPIDVVLKLEKISGVSKARLCY